MIILKKDKSIRKHEFKKKSRSIVHGDYLELSFLTCSKNHTEKKRLLEKHPFQLTFTEKSNTKGILIHIDHGQEINWRCLELRNNLLSTCVPIYIDSYHQLTPDDSYINV